MNQTELLEEILLLARQAGSAIMGIYEKDFNVEYKADESPVTDADLAAHKVIVNGLQHLTPDVPILSEESADISWDIRQTWQRYWLVDPIDGTKEFIKKNGEFTVNIALIEKGKPVLAVVDAPALGVSYIAAEAIGAFKDKGDELPQDKQAIFDLFVSCRTLKRKTDDNFGLGLYIVKLIADSHGGYVSAHNLDAGTGAIFKVSIPLIKLN